MQAMVFASLLANARAHLDPGGPSGFFGVLSGALLGLLLFLRFDAILAIGAIAGANLIVGARGQRLTIGFFAALAVAMTLAAFYMFGPMRAYATYPTEFVKNLQWWYVVLILAGGLAVVGVFALAPRRPLMRRALEHGLPAALIVVVWTLAIYAFFFRTPAGKLAYENAYALRMYASFYVTVPCLAAALAGYALVVRRRFWVDPAMVITITLFALFFFYKPRVVAEHFWASRRFLAVILPGTLLLACATATWGLGEGQRLRRTVSGAIGIVFIVLLGLQYVRASNPIVRHVEYEGLIPRLEKMANWAGDKDLLLVESRDAGSDAHVLAVPLAYIYARNILVLASAAPDPAKLAEFLEWARTRYRARLLSRRRRYSAPVQALERLARSKRTVSGARVPVHVQRLPAKRTPQGVRLRPLRAASAGGDAGDRVRSRRRSTATICTSSGFTPRRRRPDGRCGGRRISRSSRSRTCRATRARSC